MNFNKKIAIIACTLLSISLQTKSMDTYAQKELTELAKQYTGFVLADRQKLQESFDFLTQQAEHHPNLKTTLNGGPIPPTQAQVQAKLPEFTQKVHLLIHKQKTFLISQNKLLAACSFK
jgi:uncharacterized protein (DUF1800 family)